MFATKDIPKGSKISLYGGYRMDQSTSIPKDLVIPGTPYRHSIGLCGMVADIPKGYTDITKYNGTMAHKMNHNFDNSIQFDFVSDT